VPQANLEPYETVVVVTDPSGVILAVSATAETVTGRSRRHLVGSRRSVLAHPDTPLGLYLHIERELAEAQTSGGYVSFAQANGRGTWLAVAEVNTATTRVMVGVAPMRQDYLQTLEPLYERATATEQAAVAGGASLQAAAALGAETLDQSIRELGFSGYRDLTNTAIPAEALTRQAGYPPVTEGPLAPVWQGVEELAAQLDWQTAAQERLFELSTLLVLGAEDLAVRGDSLSEAAAITADGARRAGAVVSALTSASRVASSCEGAAVALGALTLGAERCQSLVLEQRSLLATARLVTQATMEVVSRERDLELLPWLAAALGGLGPGLSMGSARIGAGLTRLAREATDAAGQARVLAGAVASWELLAARLDLPGAQLPFDAEVGTLGDGLDGLRDMARGAQERAREVDPSSYVDAVADLTRILRRLRYATTAQLAAVGPLL
jgi:PAS domain S-box-containing protein